MYIWFVLRGSHFVVRGSWFALRGSHFVLIARYTFYPLSVHKRSDTAFSCQSALRSDNLITRVKAKR